MLVGWQSSRQLSKVFNWTFDTSICKHCRRDIIRRNYASAAAAVAEQDSSSSSTHPSAVPYTATEPSYQINAGVLLSRPPQITRDLTPFEKAFFFYQRRLNERLATPFTRYFYFKPRTPAYLEWKRRLDQRTTPARDIGKYNPYLKDGWNDEILLGSKESEPEEQMDALYKDATEGTSDDSRRDAIERPMPRVTQADKDGDQTSLNRALQRTLYLVVKKDGYWTLPAGDVQGRENLREAAERILIEAVGVNMNTWFVGNAPVGHSVYSLRNTPEPDENGVVMAGDKTFFMKARIMAGQAILEGNKLGFTEFKWLTREEVQQMVTQWYWGRVRNMLAER